MSQDLQNHIRSKASRDESSAQIASDSSRFWARVFLGISISILLHLLTTLATWKWAEHVAQEKQTPRRILVEWIEPSKVQNNEWENPQTQIVRKTELPPEALLPDREDVRRRFLSENRQTVKEESQAARSGLTENRSNNESRPQAGRQQASRPQQQARQATGKEKSPARDPRRRLPELDAFAGGIALPKFSRENGSGNEETSAPHELLMPADPRRLSGVSTSGERLPEDVRIGNFTALNTDRFVYYTFYARVEEQIRNRWVRYVKAAIYGGGDVSIGKNEFLTNVEIILNRQGEFVRALVHQTSGSKDLDAAPILAFREARMIPNPPREMIKPDGTIRLLYSFSVDNLPAVARAPTGGKAPESDTE